MATDSPPINAATRAIPATARPLMPSSSWCKGEPKPPGLFSRHARGSSSPAPSRGPIPE